MVQGLTGRKESAMARTKGKGLAPLSKSAGEEKRKQIKQAKAALKSRGTGGVRVK